MGYNYFLSNNTLVMKKNIVNDVLKKSNIGNVYDSYSIEKALVSTYPEFVFEVQIGENGVDDVRIRGFDYNTMKDRFKDNFSGSEEEKWKTVCTIMSDNSGILEGTATLEDERNNVLQIEY